MYSKYITSTSLLALYATLSGAVDIKAYAPKNCHSQPIATCLKQPSKVCCRFPVGGLIAKACSFSKLQCLDIGIWHYPDVTTTGDGSCLGNPRDSVAGDHSFFCLTDAPHGDSPGGGASWHFLPQCVPQPPQKSELIAMVGEVGNCTSQQPATLYAWPENEAGVYVLEPTMEHLDALDKFPATEDNTEYIEMLKQFNATYYPDATQLANYIDVISEG